MPGGMAPLKKPPNSTRLPLALNPQKSKDVLAVLAERNQTIVPVGAWVEPASPDSSEIPAYTSACMIEEELKEQQRKKQEALKRFQRQVKCRVNQQIRLRKKQQLQKSYEAAEKEGCIAMQSSNTAHFTSKRTSVFPKKLNAAVGSPRLPRSQMLGDGIEDGENENELFQQQAQALSQTMKLARQRLASFKTVTKEKASVFTDDKRKSILTQEELDYEEISSVVTNEEGGDLFQGDQQDLLSEDNDVCFSKVQKVKFKSPLFVVMEGEEQTPSYLQGFQHILPEAQDHLPEAQGDLPESQSDLTDVHSVDLEAQSVEPSAQAVEFQVQAVELECQTVELEGQDIQTDTQNSMMKAQSVELEDESTELEAQNFLPPNQAFLPKDQNTLPGYQDQDFVHVREDRDILPEDHNVLPNCQDQDFLPKEEDLLPKKLCVLPRDENILKCQNQDFLPKDRSVFSKGQDILHKCPDKDFLPRDQCVLPEEQTILPNYQDQDFLPKDQNFPFRDQHVLPNNQNIPSNYQDQNFLPKDQNILPKDYHVLPKDQTFLSRWQDQDFLSEDQHFPFRDQHVLPDNQNIPSNDQDQDFLLEDQNTLPKGQKQGFLPKYQKVRFKEPYSDMTNEEGREDFSLVDYQYQSPKLQIQDVIRDQNMFPKQPSYFMREEKVREELPLGYHQRVPSKVQQQASLREQNKYIKQPSSFEKWEIAREIVSGVPLSLSFRQQPSVGTAERWREDLPLDSHQHLPSRTQRDASSRRQVYNQSRSSTEFRAPLAFQSGVDQEEDKKERQKQYLRHRRLFMDIEREQVKQQQRQKEQKKKIEKFRGFILLLTFLIYTCYHMSRKPISVVKSRLHQNCSELEPVNNTHSPNDTTWCSWAPFDQDNYKELLGAVDNAFLVAYAIGMFISGIFGERLPLRYYLSTGMLLSGLFTSLFGLGYFWNIHMLWYFVLIQICNGLVQTTGWPSVVTCVGNWFGKGKRGLIMGVWNSHTSVGNILGSLIAGIWVNDQWGLSFVVPGIITGAVGVLTFLFLIEYPEDVDCTPPQHHGGPDEDQDNPEDPGNGPYSNRDSSLEAATSSKEPCAEPAAISFLGALRIPGVIEFSLCLLFAKLVSYTFLYWLPLYIFNVAHFSAKEAGDLSTLFDVGGIIGGIMAGLISDYTNGRATTCCVMLILAAPMMFLYNYIGQNGVISSIVMLIICGALVNGPYSLITTAVSADLGTHQSLKGNAKALSTVTAIIDGTGSVGAALGPLLAGLISPTGWNNVFYMLISADVLACLLLCRLVYKEILAWKASLSRGRGYKEI